MQAECKLSTRAAKKEVEVAFISEGTTGGLSAAQAARLFGNLQKQPNAVPGSSWPDNQQVLDHSISVTEIRLGLLALKGGVVRAE